MSWNFFSLIACLLLVAHESSFICLLQNLSKSLENIHFEPNDSRANLNHHFTEKINEFKFDSAFLNFSQHLSLIQIYIFEI